MTKLHWYLTSSLGALLAGSLAVTGCGESDSTVSGNTGGASGGSESTGGETSSGGTGGNGTGGKGDAGSPGSAGDTGSGACNVIPPSTWSAPNWQTNTAATVELTGRLSALVGSSLMQGAESGSVTDLELAQLTAALEDGDPSLSDVASDSFREVLEATFEEFVAAIEAGTGNLVNDQGEWVAGTDGGIWQTVSARRAFNAAAIELRQVVDKGVFGGVFYGYALGLTTAPITEATIDALAAAFGANSGLNLGRNNDANEENRNFFSANYIFQMGLYSEARQALIDAKAFAQDENCTAERDEAIVRFFRNWELGIMARYIFYSNQSASGVAGAAEAADRADALHAALHQQAEGIGLAWGFYGVPDPQTGPLAGAGRLMRDENIAAALAPLGIDVDGAPGDATFADFVSDPEGYAEAVEEIESVIADVFGLTATDLNAFRNPPPEGG